MSVVHDTHSMQQKNEGVGIRGGVTYLRSRLLGGEYREPSDSRTSHYPNERETTTPLPPVIGSQLMKLSIHAHQPVL
jgi:hypothetical protein